MCMVSFAIAGLSLPFLSRHAIVDNTHVFAFSFTETCNAFSFSFETIGVRKISIVAVIGEVVNLIVIIVTTFVVVPVPLGHVEASPQLFVGTTPHLCIGPLS